MARVLSFGFRNGIPEDLTALFDCRHVLNPDRSVRCWTGVHPKVATQVLGQAAAQALLDEAERVARADPEARIAFGCNYGYHRSVALAEALAARLGITAEHWEL